MRCSAGTLALALALGACGPATPGADRPAVPARLAHRVVVVSIDGLMPATYTDPDALGLAVPTLRKMVARGAFARAVEPTFPTVTYPAHTTMVTGVAPAVHGITTNRPPDPLEKNQGGWRWYAEDIAVPTLWDAVEAAGGRAAVITWPVTVGAKVHLRVPEFWRAGTADDQKLLRALSTPGFLDDVAREYPELWTTLAPPDVKDEAQLRIARYVVDHAAADLVLAHAWMLDDAQHAHGPGSVEAKAAIERADALLGELLAAIERSPDAARTILVVVSDHGFHAVTKQLRPNVRFAERGLVTLGADGKPTAAKLTFLASGGTAFVYVTDPSAQADVEAAIASLGEGVAKVYRRDEIAAAGGDPAAAFVLAAAPGYQFSDLRGTELVVAATNGGDHGYVPTDPAMAASFVAVGADVPRADLGTIRMIDVAPTIARWLGVALPRAEGRAVP
jgi:predicted AlkP superfamily pyrophosphatase or phosphodiesterase